MYVQIAQLQMLTVLMDNYGSEVEPFLEKAEWRCAMNVNGGQCVIIPGEHLMQKWSVGSLDSLPLVIFLGALLLLSSLAPDRTCIMFQLS